MDSSTSKIFVLKSIFEYQENRDPKILLFRQDEHFVMIKDPDKSSDWYYVINENGQIGYVPNSYVVYEENLSIKQLLQLIDSIASKLDQKNNEQNKILTDRQLKHAQIKLAQMRCEINEIIMKQQQQQLQQSSATKSMTSILKSSCLSNELSVIHEENKEDDESNGQVVFCLKKCPNCCFKNDNDDNDPKENKIDEQLIINLIENLKLDTNLNESRSILILNSVIKTFNDYDLPKWKDDLCKIQDIMNQYINEKLNNENVYTTKLKCIFKRLWSYKNDEQQLNWPIYQDEDIINGYLDELLNLLITTEQKYLEMEISSKNFENLVNLIQYYQMETRRSIRLKLIDIFICLLRLYRNISPEFYLTTVLPSELAIEMKNHVQDKDRWIKISILFTLIFSSGHKPPVQIYDHINEQFFTHLFNLCEGFDVNGETIDNFEIPSENIISPILAFNLHQTDYNDNVIFKSLRKRTNVSHFTENLISYLNWEEDIILQLYNNFDQYKLDQNQHLLAMISPLSTSNNSSTNAVNHNDNNNGQSHSNQPQNSVLKFLIEMFADKIVSSLFYYNDVRIIIDIIISQLNNLPVGDNRIRYYLELTANILKNTQYVEEPHKLYELKKCLINITKHEFSNVCDLNLVQNIFDNNNDIFNFNN